jgi:hypothetical protein
VKKFVIAVAAAFALLVGAGTASAGHYHQNVQVIRQFKLVGGSYGCGHDAVAVAVATDTYDAPVEVRKVVKVVRVNGGYNDVQIVNVNGYGRFGARGFGGGFRAANGGNSGVVGAAKVIVNTAKNLVGDIIGN